VIWRLGATAGAILPVAAAAVASDRGATVATSVPVIWSFLGYPFEAGSMIAAVFACVCARFWIGAGQAARQQHRWTLDLPVTGIALAVAGLLVIKVRPDPLTGLLLGGGAGVLGEGFFKLAEGRLRAVGLLGEETGT
jgi:hypothetical protein